MPSLKKLIVTSLLLITSISNAETGSSIMDHRLSLSTLFIEPFIGKDQKPLIPDTANKDKKWTIDATNPLYFKYVSEVKGYTPQVSEFYYTKAGKLTGVTNSYEGKYRMVHHVAIDPTTKLTSSRTDCSYNRKSGVYECTTASTKLCKYLEESSILRGDFFNQAKSCSDSCSATLKILQTIPKRYLDDAYSEEGKNLALLKKNHKKLGSSPYTHLNKLKDVKETQNKLRSIYKIAAECRNHLSRKSQEELNSPLDLTEKEIKAYGSPAYEALQE